MTKFAKQYIKDNIDFIREHIDDRPMLHLDYHMTLDSMLKSGEITEKEFDYEMERYPFCDWSYREKVFSIVMEIERENLGIR